MVNYTCYRCGYESHIKTIMLRHVNRKNKCPAKINDIDFSICKEYMLQGLTFGEYTKIYKNIQKCSQNVVKNESNCSQNVVKCSQNVVKNESMCSQNVVKCSQNVVNIKSSKKYECKFCSKEYLHSSSLYKHLKSCKDKIKSDEVNHSMKELINLLNEQLEDCKKEISKQNNQIDQLIKKAGITNNVNIQNNYKLLSYKDTDISHLSDIDIRYCIGHNNLCVPHLVKKLHFNPTKPENHNIYISNIKNNYVMKYDGEKWNLEDQEDAIDTLIDDKQLILEQKLEEWIENGKNYPEIMEKFNRYIEKRDNNDVINVIKQEIKLLLFNNRHVIKNIQMIK